MMGLHALGVQSSFFATSMNEPLRSAASPAGVPTPAQSEQREFLALLMARVGDAFVRKPFFVDAGLDLVSVCRLLAQHGLTHALVRDGERIGMFTTTDLRDALLRAAPAAELAVRDVAQFDLVAVHPQDPLFEALLKMIRHRVHRVVVRDGDAVLGVLGQLDLMSYVSNHSHLIASQIEQAATVDALQAAALQVEGMVALLHSGGAHIDVIAALVRELNAQLLAKLWSLLAPAELVANSCLLVMGSEGRGEQIVRTDQDNALLLRDGFTFTGLEQVAADFNAALIRFGFPRCPGDIMLTNPLWRQPLASFKATLRDWLFGADPLAPMNLAIFLDARPVAGDTALLQEARRFVHHCLVDNDAFFARFARAVDQFAPARRGWARWWLPRKREEPLFDLKKLGTFPIVHGARALALQHHVEAVSTTERLAALVQRHALDPQLAADLAEALHFLMGLKLKNHLRQRGLGALLDNQMRLSQLGRLERDALQDSLAIIQRFRQHLHRHFKLDAL
jgi:CBS domain-containing protein